MTDHTPTTEEMRIWVAMVGGAHEHGGESLARFNRWLAALERKITTEVREQVAREVEAERENTEDGSGVEAYLSGLKRGIEIVRADRIEQGDDQ